MDRTMLLLPRQCTCSPSTFVFDKYKYMILPRAIWKTRYMQVLRETKENAHHWVGNYYQTPAAAGGRGGKPELPGTRVKGDWRREAGCLFWEGVCAYLLLIQTPGNERCLISCLNSPFSPLPNAPIIQRFPSLSWLGFQRKIQTKTLEQCSMEHGWRQKSKQNAFNPGAFSPPENSKYKTSQKMRMLSMDPVHY